LLEDGLFHEILGRRIAWWNEAIVHDPTESMRGALARLTEWVWDYAKKHPESRTYTKAWGATLGWGFPRGRYRTATQE